MRADKMQREELAAFLGTDEGRAFMDGIDARWSEAIEPMRRAGFILSAYGGMAVMCTYKSIVEAQGADVAARMLQMNGVEVPIGEE